LHIAAQALRGQPGEFVGGLDQRGGDLGACSPDISPSQDSLI